MPRLKFPNQRIPFAIHKKHFGKCVPPCSAAQADPLGLPPTASTVIIGGGITGTSAAYHLAKQGETNVVLLEKSELTSGSTWHAAGLTTFYNGGVNMKQLHWNSMNIYSQLEKETDQDITFRQPGSIRLAFHPDRVKEFQHQMTRVGWQPAPQKLLTPDEVKQMVPILKTDKLLMGLYNPYDGHVDPYSLTQALAKGARRHGALIRQQTPVISMSLTGLNKWLVGTPDGEILADRVINAAGFWASDVAQLAGYSLPLVAQHHQYLITSSLPEIEALDKEMPVLRHMEGSSYIRQEKQGLLLGSYEHPDLVQQMDSWVNEGVPPTFGKELFPSDLDRMMNCLTRVMEDVPVLERAHICSIINGPITYSPDGLPLIGPDQLPNMWTLAGFGFGIIHGGGAGKYIADWIQNGEPPYEMIECDPLRFKAYADKKYIVAKASESYGLVNTIGYSNEERFAGRPTQRISSAYPKQVERGAHMQFHSGWEQPAWFALPGQQAEYLPSFERGNWHEPMRHEWQTVTSAAGVIDLSPFAKLVVEGPEAIPFIDHITANKVPEVGRTVISHLLTPNAKVYAELTITQTKPNQFFIITGSGSELHDLRWMENYARLADWKVTLRSVTDEYGCLSIAGPQSCEVLRKLSPRFNEKFPFLRAEEVMIAGIKTLAMRITYTGELGWELYHPRHQTRALYERLLETGFVNGVNDFGTMTLNALRLEKGFRMWGAEINKDRTLVEAGLLYFVNQKKKHFVGMTAQRRLQQTVPKEMLVMATVDNETKSDPRGDESCWISDKYVGKTTSGCYSFLLNQSLMFCYLPPALTTPGVKFEVDLDCGRHWATVLRTPPALPYSMRTT